MTKRQPLRPGEVKILEALLKDDKTNGELQKETGLQSNILSEYLKNLQRLGLVERNIDTRKYGAKRKYVGRVPITVQVLFFNEVLDFVRAQFEKSIKIGNEKAGIISGPIGWVVMTETREERTLHIGQLIEKRLKDLKNFEALLTVSRIIEDSWEEYYFRTMGKSETRIRTIETYKQFLREIAEQMYPLELPEQDHRLFAELLEDIKKKMSGAYPGVNVPEEMIRLEANRRMKKFAERHAMIMMRPANLKQLYATLETFEKLKDQNSSQKDLPKEEMQKLLKKIDYLKDPKNKKIYEEYLDHLRDVPKSLIFYPSWGFKGYPEQLIDLVPRHKKGS
jgi:hypothetical protein